MPNVDFLFLVEHVNRELETNVVMQRLLERQGCSVAFASIYFDFWRAVQEIRPRSVVTPWCYDDRGVHKITRWRSADETGMTITNLHHEQVSFASTIADRFMPKGRAKETLHASWGPAFTELLRHCGVPGELIRETGSPRLDFYRPEFRAFSPSREELGRRFGLNADEPWILVLGNFKRIALSEERIAKLEREGFGLVRQVAKEEHRTYEALMTWLDALCAAVEGKAAVIYRPHPIEPVLPPLGALAVKRRNLAVIGEGPVRHWILAAERIAGWTSTSLVEALVAGRPCFALRPFADAELFRKESFPVIDRLPVIEGREAFVEILSGAKGFDGAVWRGAKDELTRHYALREEPATVASARLALDGIRDGRVPRFATSGFPAWKKALYRVRENAKGALLRRGTLLERILPKYRVQARDLLDDGEIGRLREMTDDMLRRTGLSLETRGERKDGA